MRVLEIDCPEMLVLELAQRARRYTFLSDQIAVRNESKGEDERVGEFLGRSHGGVAGGF